MKTIETNGWMTPKPSKNHWKQWCGGWKSVNGNGWATQKPWKTIDANGSCKKRYYHPIALEKWPLFTSILGLKTTVVCESARANFSVWCFGICYKKKSIGLWSVKSIDINWNRLDTHLSAHPSRLLCNLSIKYKT